MTARGHVGLGFKGVRQVINAINEGCHSATGDERHHMSINVLETASFFGRGEPTERAPCEGRAFHEQLREIDCRLASAHQTNTCNAAINRETLKVELLKVTSDHV